MFYRWSVDLAGPFPLSRQGNRYAMIMVEHFSKWIEVVTIPRKEARFTAEAFLHRVLTMFGAPAEVLTDQGTEFEGEFQALLEECLIDHRRTSRDHPQADGLAERCVQSVKLALRKYCRGQDQALWDVHMPWLTMGYRCSVQSSLGFSPYFLLFGRHPGLPGSALLHAAPPEMDDEAVADMILARAAIFKQSMPIAMMNLETAQHRDRMWYARRRSGTYRKPTAHSFRRGDFVYPKGIAGNTLEVGVTPVILQVEQILESGVLELKGADGSVKKEHWSNCVPCHLPIVEEVAGRMEQIRTHPDLHLALQVAADPCVVCTGTLEEAGALF